MTTDLTSVICLIFQQFTFFENFIKFSVFCCFLFSFSNKLPDFLTFSRNALQHNGHILTVQSCQDFTVTFPIVPTSAYIY